MWNALSEILARFVVFLKRFLTGGGKQKALFFEAECALGQDVSPKDLAPDELGCAESVSTLIAQIINFPIITGTWTLNQRMLTDKRFIRVEESAGAGTIIISPTGTGNGKIRGHVGIVGVGDKIMANNSTNGLWLYGYTLKTWENYFGRIGGLPTYFYILI